jgi:hypothetical protein
MKLGKKSQLPCRAVAKKVTVPAHTDSRKNLELNIMVMAR